jgi:hypothetical protein
MEKIILCVFILLTACSARNSDKNDTTAFLPGRKLAELKNKNLNEISGIAASINNPTLLWAHNDKGNDAEVFLLDENLNIKLTCKIKGIKNRDWEDIATGPGPDPNKNYLYIGDIGDNDAHYQFKYIYRIEEPTWEEGQEPTTTITSFDVITFQLPDKRKDTEALLINPATKDLYVISKREKPVYVYELKYPYSETDTLTASKLSALPFSLIVAGDFSADGSEILIKNYKSIYYWKAPSQKSVADIFNGPATELPYEAEPQGEAITWARDGKGFYTLSEKISGEKSYLYYYERNNNSSPK